MNKLLYHITHIDNLPRIIAEGGLLCDRLRVQTDVTIKGIAYQHIKDRRAKRIVPIAAQGTLADYVPFYFAPRSPMLFTIHKGKVIGYTEGQKPVIYLVSSVDKVLELNNRWCFTDGHAEMEFSSFFSDLYNLDEIDWNVMDATYWNDTPTDSDRKRRRQAEFLVYESFPWEAVTEIVVFDEEIKRKVEQTLVGHPHRPPVDAKSEWYY